MDWKLVEMGPISFLSVGFATRVTLISENIWGDRIFKKIFHFTQEIIVHFNNCNFE